MMMKQMSRSIALSVLGCAGLFSGASAQADDVEACRGGYSIMLMTPAECRTYLKQLKDVHARADKTAELELREWHTQLLIQRAETCPCLQGQEPRLLGEHTASSQPHSQTQR